MREIRFREAIGEAMMEEMTRDDRVFLLGEDMQWAWSDLYEKFGPERVMNAPISESAQAGVAVGAAILGTRPILEILFADLLPLSMDHIVNDAAKISYQYASEVSCPVVIRCAIGVSGRGSGLHHSQPCEAWILNTPGLTVMMPSTPHDAKGLLKSAIRDENPVVFLEDRLCREIRGTVPDEDYVVSIGEGDVKREGVDVTIVAAGAMVHRALEAAEKLQNDGVACEVVDPRTLLPLDEDVIINSVKKTNRLVIVHEAPIRYGYGAEIAAVAAEKALEYLDAPVKRVGNPGTPIPYSRILENAVIPNVDDIIKAVNETLA
jgi:pyruvate dehydrogenase E1 component beta subunit